MVKERYCSPEVSRLLREKGFNEECHHIYVDVTLEWTNTIYGDDVISNNEIPDVDTDVITAPTNQMACDWLREVHGIFIAINNDDLDFNWQCYDLINRSSTLDPKILSESYAGYKAYGEAVEAALKYSLENLV